MERFKIRDVVKCGEIHREYFIKEKKKERKKERRISLRGKLAGELPNFSRRKISSIEFINFLTTYFLRPLHQR